MLATIALVLACGSDEPRGDGVSSFGPASATLESGTPSSESGATTNDASSTSVGGTADGTASESSSGAGSSSDGGSEASTGAPSEPFAMSDSLREGGTTGTAVGGAFGPEGWTVTGNADRIYWALPRLVEGSVEFTVTGITVDNLPLNDHEIFAMYDGGYAIEHPIGYDPEFRNNDFKSMIRIYGQAEGDRVGQQKLMWGLCPGGAPGYGDGTCSCGSSFFDEPFRGDGVWDGSPQRLRVEWVDGVTRLLRNDAEVTAIEWGGSGLTFGPDALYVSIGTPRPEAVDTASMPIGAVFSDVVIEGVTGPIATCG